MRDLGYGLSNFCRVRYPPVRSGRKTIADHIPDASEALNDAGIVVSNLSHKLDGTPFFDNLSLKLTERRIGLIGRNGSGKSTLSRLMSGLVAPTDGNIRIHGVDVYKDRAAAIRTIGLIFQNPDHQIIFPTVEEEIAFGLESLCGDKKQAREKAKAFLKAFGRSEWAERGTFTLSQGQRHLVCLMAVLAMEPKVIFLDEPFAGLDWPTSRRLFDWLDKLDQQVLLVTHDIDHLASFDRIIWLEKGSLMGDGTPTEVLPAYREAMEAFVHVDDPILGGNLVLDTARGDI
ncbi:energy-coupling factor ABC transporter ATP-binding protein [Cohaesibacter celericrescens]|uniref:Cobalt ABC transporter n=1 Tax=Cohaesibacter celericrescens TaxID=2067669 RepID=A0A2N5XVF6_9HYPH|nr:ABC transporter ATP-binding protein [Cohaesibacter celericrescens]PLW78447.1 cobalt ABC transporter [Cohaesibacter celericrescens]